MDTSRTGEILEAVDLLIQVHDDWESDPKAPDVPTAKFEEAVLACVEVCNLGDTPSKCRELVDAVSRMGVEWEKYAGGEMGPGHRPRGSFWGAMRAVFHAREGAAPLQHQPIEPVSLLLKQGVSQQQIALHIYGDGKTGPLVGPNGQPDATKILQEADNPGSVIPKGWVHPREDERISAHRERLKHRLAAAERHEDLDRQTEDPATVEELLREGAFPQQVARVKNVPLDEVLQVAEKLRAEGVKVNEPPNLSSMRAPHEPQLTPEQDKGLQPKQPSGDAFDFGADDPESGESAPDIDTLIQLVHEEHPDLGAGELVSILADQHETEVSVQKVAGVLRKQRETVA